MQKSPKMPKITENAKNHQKCQKSQKMPKITEHAKNHRKCQKSPKMPKITENAKNHRKCKKSPKMQKSPRMPNFYQSFFFFSFSVTSRVPPPISLDISQTRS